MRSNFTPEMIAEYGIEKNIVPAALDLAKYKGKLYGVPIWVRPMTIFYKKSIFDKYGIAEPKTFDELEQACKVLKANGIALSLTEESSAG
jgi:raffinose/stachyose/melibiose transport system substrate-binding protein